MMLAECPFSPAARAAILLPFDLYEQYDEVVSTSGCNESVADCFRAGELRIDRNIIQR